MNSAPTELWRIGIAELARWACNYGTIGKLHERYGMVTEGRDARQNWKYYSSCADLGHWEAKRVGVRESWVNRDDDDAHGPWERTKNVGKLAVASKPPRVDYVPGVGDIWILSNTWTNPDPKIAGRDAHVCVVLGPNVDRPGEFWTANYGASGLTEVETPGGKISSKIWSAGHYGSKRLAEVLEVPDLVARQTVAADFSGPENWTAEWTGEVKEALEAWA